MLPKKNKKKLDLTLRKEDFGVYNWHDQFIEQNKTNLPRSIFHDDLDIGFNNFVDNELELVVENNKVPVYFMSTQKWAEFYQNWDNNDKYGNYKIPFIIIIRDNNPQKGTNPADFKIPVRKTFNYLKVPTWDGNKKGMDIYKIPQPVGVDILYTVKLFSFRLTELNKFNKLMLTKFSSAQAYVNIKGHYFPMLLESNEDESNVNEIEAKRYFTQTFKIKLQGYLLDEDEFEVVPGVERSIIFTELDDKRKKPRIYMEKDCEGVLNTVSYSIQFLPNSITSYNFRFDFLTKLETIEGNNVNDFTFLVNGIEPTLPITITPSDILTITITRNNSNILSEIIFRGVTNI
jgi:hypothetical protein